MNLPTEIKDRWDVILQIIALAGTALAFILSLLQWRRGQSWQRAEKLDQLIEKFETDDLLRFGAVALDWTKREVTFRGSEVVITNEDVLLSLRDFSTITERPMYPGQQATMRDAYDALITFFQRLELSISTGLIDARPAEAYFAYWLERLVTLDRHSDPEGKILKGKSPEAMIRAYIELYGDLESIERLCRAFGIEKAVNEDVL